MRKEVLPLMLAFFLIVAGFFLYLLWPLEGIMTKGILIFSALLTFVNLYYVHKAKDERRVLKPVSICLTLLALSYIGCEWFFVDENWAWVRLSAFGTVVFLTVLNAFVPNINYGMDVENK